MHNVGWALCHVAAKICDFCIIYKCKNSLFILGYPLRKGKVFFVFVVLFLCLNISVLIHAVGLALSQYH